MKQNIQVNIWLAILVSLLVGAGSGFFAGIKYQKYQRDGTVFRGLIGNGPMGGRFVAGGAAGARGGMGAFRPVAGEIIAADDKSATIKLNDGSSKIVMLSEKTEINEATEATVSDLKTGAKVVVFGATNSDGSLTATSIQLNPQFRLSGEATPPAAKQQ